ncbi:MAG: AMP-binding protein [Deinococcota bacterium]|jgi:phenylacetate-CoA ligase|nr:AMP-binding protein [Deinococcota bacterium]
MFNPDMETLPSDKLRKLQDERLAKLMAYLYERLPFYRKVLDEAGTKPSDVTSVDDLPKLPFTRKSDLRDHYPFGLFAVPKSKVARIHVSSGTTGKPTVVGYSRRDLELFAEVNARALAAAGARPGMTLHNAYGYGLFTGGLGLHYGGERLGLTVVPVSGGMTERQLLLIEDFKPDIIACTPSYAQTLAESFRRRGVPPEEISLSYAILGAEPWTEAIRQDVERGLGVKASNIYGLSEVIGPGVAQEAWDEQDGSYLCEDHFYPEIVDPGTGEPLADGQEGVLVLTTLTKEATPLLRYWTGDITSLTRAASTTGRTHARMGGIRGRSDDMLIIRGVNVYPTQIEEILRGRPEAAAHYQLVISRSHLLDEVELRLELSEAAFSRMEPANRDPARFDDLVEADEELRSLRRGLEQSIKERVGVSVKVTLMAPGSVPRSEGGKLSRVLDERKG